MKIKIHFSAVMIILSLVITGSPYTLATFSAVFLHELAHWFTAKLLGIRFQQLTLGAFGAILTPKYRIGAYQQELCIALAGPAVNLLFYILTARQAIPFLAYFSSVSLFLALLNLLPIQDFDGGRPLQC